MKEVQIKICVGNETTHKEEKEISIVFTAYNVADSDAKILESLINFPKYYHYIKSLTIKNQ